MISLLISNRSADTATVLGTQQGNVMTVTAARIEVGHVHSEGAASNVLVGSTSGIAEGV
jgi:hypothetical protein